MRAVFAVVLIAVAAAACGVDAASLPYYADRDFTPSWSPVPHSVTTHTLADTPFLDQSGAAVTPASLAGRPHVASFIFTTCASICPPLVTQLKRVQSALATTNVQMVSYSITPQIDTVKVLAKFGADRGIDPARWSLLTGTPEGVHRLASDAYFADDDGDRTIVAGDAFLHTEKVLLVDATGHIRGVYNGTQPFEIDKLIDDVRTLSAGASR